MILRAYSSRTARLYGTVIYRLERLTVAGNTFSGMTLTGDALVSAGASSPATVVWASASGGTI